MKSFPLICGVTFALSLVNEAFRPANSTAIAHFSREENRTRSYSLNRLAINLGWAVGGATGGILASINYHLLFWVDGVTNIAAAILLRYLLSGDIYPEAAVKKEINGPRVLSPYRDKNYLVFIFIYDLICHLFFSIIYYATGLL